MDSSELVLWDGVIELTALLHPLPILLMLYLVTGISSSFKKFVKLVSFHICWAQMFLRLGCTSCHDFNHPKLPVMSDNFRYNFYGRNNKKWFIWRWRVIDFWWLKHLVTGLTWECKNVTWLKSGISIPTHKRLLVLEGGQRWLWKCFLLREPFPNLSKHTFPQQTADILVKSCDEDEDVDGENNSERFVLFCSHTNLGINLQLFLWPTLCSRQEKQKNKHLFSLKLFGTFYCFLWLRN